MYIILRIRGSKHRGLKYVFFCFVTIWIFFDPKCKSVVIEFRQSSKGWVQNCAAQHGQFQGMESSWRSFGWDSLAMLPLSLGSHDVTPGDCTPIASDLPSVWAQSTTATVAGFILPKCHMTWEFRTFATSVCFRPCRHAVPCHAIVSLFQYVFICSYLVRFVWQRYIPVNPRVFLRTNSCRGPWTVDLCRFINIQRIDIQM